MRSKCEITVVAEEFESSVASECKGLLVAQRTNTTASAKATTTGQFRSRKPGSTAGDYSATPRSGPESGPPVLVRPARKAQLDAPGPDAAPRPVGDRRASCWRGPRRAVPV